MTLSYRWIPVFAGAALSALPQVSPAVALAAGVAVALLGLVPDSRAVSTWSKKLLQYSVVGLGFGVSIATVLATGLHALPVTFASIAAVMALGYGLGRLLGVDDVLGTLISGGTAICGGSAIAALAPAIQASAGSTAIALASVFSLNALGLVLYPPIGHALEMSQNQFGLWAALGIHDTSSVVGAAAAYGATALAVGTTVKLARALWILPLASVVARLRKTSATAPFPYFLLFFLLAATAVYALPQLGEVWGTLYAVARRLLVATLFLIGSTLNRQALATVGLRPFAFALLLWIIVSVASAAGVLLFAE